MCVSGMFYFQSIVVKCLQVSYEQDFVFLTYVCVGLCACGIQARIMQSLGQALEIEVFDKDEGNNDDKLGKCSLDISQVVRFGRLDTWQTLQQAKHGKVELRLSWHRLTSDVSELSRALTETLLIKTGELSSAVLSVYIDSCKKLPNARTQSRPDPYLTVTVGKKTETSAVQMRTDDPVYEIGYSFLVQNPECDNLEIKILKDAIKEEDYEDEPAPAVVETPREPSPPVVPPSPPSPTGSGEPVPPLTDPVTVLPEPIVKNVEDALLDSSSQKSVPLEHIEKEVDTPQEHLPPKSPEHEPPSKLTHRISSLTTSAGEAGLGRILLSLRYSMQNQTLFVVVHKIMHIPLKDPTNVPDPYVKLYLLPGRSKDSKRKTVVVKDSCMPEYDEQFEWVIPLAELHSRQVEVTVATHKGFLGGSPVIGQVVVHLNQYDFREAKTMWFDLLPETSPRD
ncbi:hypothetical protein HF086_001322 [Spodoptera exigua]|uniref:C2 domain-containing protein n=1 Tax=Spodoptera exigua TaxID=7107 RepID=A0A922MBX1_SPOEX|nr:hypothetical protein HF086_001322 [Spodoptera exigua]